MLMYICLCISTYQLLLTALAYPMQIVKVTANVIPQPATTTVQHYAILLAVIIIWLIFSPGRFLHNLA